MSKKKTIFCIVIMLMLICTNAYASIDGKLKIGSSKTEIKAGDEFEITLSLDNVSSTNGIDSVDGYIDIDENVIEPLTLTNIVTNSDGNVEIGSNSLKLYDASTVESSSAEAASADSAGVIFNTNPVTKKGDYRIVINLPDPLKSTTDLVKIKFKVKDGVAAKEYKNAIGYTLFNIYSGTSEKLTLGTEWYNLTVSDNGTTPRPPVNNNINNRTNNTPVRPNNNRNVPRNTRNTNSRTNSPVNNGRANSRTNSRTNNPRNSGTQNTRGGTNQRNSSQQQGGEDNTRAKGNLPYTGYRLVIFPIIIVAIVGFVLYQRYRKYKNMIK